ncbi:FkbM family methyltransferase [Apibacter muscae]|uniref:FkbM family methyltransferase n=1 Tax=Apibacter muscae TaxID=2509004 RepID=UPI0011AC2750|nr:FkbM family methyltransferase [Apibacter muscae]TWP22895.1 FkbM family methyltransferase [Apibacter muscae]
MTKFREKLIEFTYKYLPYLYKKRFFKKLNHLTKINIEERNVEYEFLYLSEYLKPNNVFFDVGSNVGSYLYYVEKIIGSNHIYGFEPNPYLFKRTKHLFPSVHLEHLALCNTQGTLTFKVPSINNEEISTRGTLKTEYVEDNETSFKLLGVPADTLDNYVNKNHIKKIDFLKIDVEGAEMDVIAGGINAIQKFKPILIVEVEERHHNQESVWKVIQPILKLGYDPYFWDKNSFQLKNFTSMVDTNQKNSDIQNKKQYLNNFIFLPKN